MAVDSLGFGDALATMPEQLAAAHEVAGKVPAPALPDAGAFDRIVTLGMGGSGIAGNFLQAVGTATLPVPVTVLKHYRTPAFVGPRTLAFAVSYSGDTEETLEMARGAHAAGATVVAITAGGALAQFAREQGALHVPCPEGIPVPRLALGALVAPLFVILFRMGMLPEAHAAKGTLAWHAAHPAEPPMMSHDLSRGINSPSRSSSASASSVRDPSFRTCPSRVSA